MAKKELTVVIKFETWPRPVFAASWWLCKLLRIQPRLWMFGKTEVIG